MKKFGVGVIGYGWVAGAHIAAINETGKAEVRMVQSSRKLDPAEVSATHGGDIRTTKTLTTMLQDPEIDVVSICSYPWQHVMQAIAAAGAGKHLIIEKPLALRYKDLVALRKAVKKSGVQVCVCFECRFSSQFLSTKAIIDKGLLGQIHYGEVDYYHGIGPWYGQVSLEHQKARRRQLPALGRLPRTRRAAACMDGEVESVSSYSTGSKNKDFKKYEYDTSSVTILRFKDGRIGKTASVIDCLQPYYFSHPSGRQRGQPARQQVALQQARRARQKQLERDVDEDAR